MSKRERQAQGQVAAGGGRYARRRRDRACDRVCGGVPALAKCGGSQSFRCLLPQHSNGAHRRAAGAGRPPGRVRKGQPPAAGPQPPGAGRCTHCWQRTASWCRLWAAKRSCGRAWRCDRSVCDCGPGLQALMRPGEKDEEQHQGSLCPCKTPGAWQIATAAKQMQMVHHRQPAACSATTPPPAAVRSPCVPYSTYTGRPHRQPSGRAKSEHRCYRDRTFAYIHVNAGRL